MKGEEKRERVYGIRALLAVEKLDCATNPLLSRTFVSSYNLSAMRL
jgi:hypothetical protein